MYGDKKLSDHLRNVTAEALRNNYFKSFLSGEQTRLPMVYISEEESTLASTIDSQSKAAIQKILMLIEDLQKREGKLMGDVFLTKQWRQKQNMTILHFITLYLKISKCIVFELYGYVLDL